jgi:hypothetical protein
MRKKNKTSYGKSDVKKKGGSYKASVNGSNLRNRGVKNMSKTVKKMCRK